MLKGKKEGRDNGNHPKDEVFFSAGYLEMYPDVAKAKADPWRHYVLKGKKEGRDNGLHPNLYPPETGMREILRLRNPSVAVIMPVYNRKDRVMNAINSVQNQSWSNWHLYIADDFSNDGTYEFLNSKIFDSRITLLRSKKKGQAGARNTALAQIQNEDFVAYLDSDNTWNQEYLELMLCRLLETNACCCYGVQKIFQRMKNGSIKISSFRYDSFDISRLRYRNFIDINVLMHSAGILKEIHGFDESLHVVEDWDFILRLAERYSFCRLPYVSCNYDDTKSESRVTPVRGKISSDFGNIVRNKHWIDWDLLSKTQDKSDESLVSVIIYFSGNDSPSFLRSCLQSLKRAGLYGNSKYRTEIIVVDDTCTEEGHAIISRFHSESLIDKYIVNDFACNFPLSCNRALSIARGHFIVYLDPHSYVSINWLDRLVDPMTRHNKLLGTTSKILEPDGSVNSAGCVYDHVSGIPYDLMRTLPGSFQASRRLTLLPCANSYCCAFRRSDIVARKGLYSIYESKLAIADLCLQLSNGQSSFAYIPHSTVICPSDRYRPDTETDDLAVFAERWHGKDFHSEQKIFDRIHLSEYVREWKKICSISFKKCSDTSCTRHSTIYHGPVYDLSLLGYGCEVNIEFQSALQSLCKSARLIAIKIPVPEKPEYKKYEWGDYYYAKCLAKSFAKLGFNTRVDFVESWYAHDDGLCINIVLRGLLRFDCKRSLNSFNILWVISHPDLVDASELNEYDCVLVASEILAAKYRNTASVRVPCTYMPQCTDSDIFSPVESCDAYAVGNLFLGNSRNVLRDVVRAAIEAGVDIKVIGNNWSKFIGHELIWSDAVPNLLLPFFYCSSDTVLNDHWSDMRQYGIVSNRIFDVLACCRGIVTDNIQNIPKELRFACFSWEDGDISDAIEKCRQFNNKLGKRQEARLRKIICDKYSFDRRAKQIAEFINTFRSNKFGAMYLEMLGADSRLYQQSNPRLSVVIPVYNGEQFIRSCLDSVLQHQDLPDRDLEVISIDDGSTDATPDILEEYKNNDQRLRVVRLESPEHAGSARNIGIRLARGRFIHFVDADDQVADNCYSAWVAALEQSGADFSCARYREVDYSTKKPLKVGGKSVIEKVRIVDVSNNKSELIRSSVAPWNKLYSKSFIIKNGLIFDRTMIRNDRSFYLGGVLKASKIMYYGEFVYDHFVNRSGSLVFQSGRNFRDVVDVFKNVYDIYRDSDPKIFHDVMDIQFKDLFFWYRKCIGTDYENDALKAVQDFLYTFCRENRIAEKCGPDVTGLITDFEKEVLSRNV